MANYFYIANTTTFVVLTRLSGAGYQRNRAAFSSVDKGHTGSTVITADIPRLQCYLWTLSFVVTPEQKENLDSIYEQYCQDLAADLTPYIAVVDTLDPVIETQPRRRATADAPDNTVFIRSDGKLRYFAKFYAGINNYEIAQKLRRDYIVSLSLVETERFAA